MDGVGQQQWQEDQEILCPLMQPEGFRQSNRRARAVDELPAHFDISALQSAAQPEVRIGEHGPLGAFEEWQIGKGVADVVEAFGSKPLLQMLQLIVSGEVHCAIAGHYIVKDAQVSGDTPGQESIGPSGQVELASSRMFVSKIVQQGTVVRE